MKNPKYHTDLLNSNPEGTPIAPNTAQKRISPKCSFGHHITKELTGKDIPCRIQTCQLC